MTSKMTVNHYGDKIWTNEKGEYHREDGPAIIFKNGYKSWWLNDLRHRVCGPAIERENGNKEWWMRGKDITDLVRELLSKSPFDEDTHLGILAEYWAERDDFRLLDIVQPYLAKKS